MTVVGVRTSGTSADAAGAVHSVTTAEDSVFPNFTETADCRLIQISVCDQFVARQTCPSVSAAS